LSGGAFRIEVHQVRRHQVVAIRRESDGGRAAGIAIVVTRRSVEVDTTSMRLAV